MKLPNLKDIVSLLLLIMIFMHIIDDYYLQGCLAKMKQKDFWKEYVEKDSQYKYDYLMALFMHGFSWSFMIHLPIIILYFIYGYTVLSNFLSISIFINAIIHSIVDNLKCNKFKINLMEDQEIHIFQIIVVFFTFIILPNYII